MEEDKMKINSIEVDETTGVVIVQMYDNVFGVVEAKFQNHLRDSGIDYDVNNFMNYIKSYLKAADYGIELADLFESIADNNKTLLKNKKRVRKQKLNQGITE
jgi:hypothetical protein